MALDPGIIQAIDQQVDGLKDWLVEQTCRLVQIPTVNPYSGDDSASRETPGQVHMAKLLKDLGGAVQTVQVPDDVFARAKVIGPTPRDYRDRYNVIGTFPLGNGNKSVLLNCHMDTVGTQGYDGDPYSGHVQDNKIFGRGATDSKGNLIVGLGAIRALRQSNLPLAGQVLFESVVDEECNGSGGGTLANRLAGISAGACICLDGAGLYPCIGCAGVATAAVDVLGKGGHAASGAVNAIDKAVMVKLAIDKMANRRQALRPPQMMNLGIFKSGTLPAVVPEAAHLEYNISYAIAEAQAASQANRGWGAALVRDEFETAVAQASSGDDWLNKNTPKIFWIKDLYPFETVPDEPIVKAASLAYQTVFRQERKAAPMGAWFDGAHISRFAGIPVVGMGAGTMKVAHSQLEYVQIDELLVNTKAVALAIYAFLMDAV